MATGTIRQDNCCYTSNCFVMSWKSSEFGRKVVMRFGKIMQTKHAL